MRFSKSSRSKTQAGVTSKWGIDQAGCVIEEPDFTACRQPNQATPQDRIHSKHVKEFGRDIVAMQAQGLPKTGQCGTPAAILGRSARIWGRSRAASLRPPSLTQLCRPLLSLGGSKRFIHLHTPVLVGKPGMIEVGFEGAIPPAGVARTCRSDVSGKSLDKMIPTSIYPSYDRNCSRSSQAFKAEPAFAVRVFHYSAESRDHDSPSGLSTFPCCTIPESSKS